MTDKKKPTNTSFSQQQGTQVSNACERVQNAIGINNSTIAGLNEDLVRKADEIAIKWRAYGLPYNAICDAVIEMAIWQKEQILKNSVAVDIWESSFSGEHYIHNQAILDDLINRACQEGETLRVAIIKETTNYAERD